MIGTVVDGGIGSNTLKKVAEYVEANGIEQSIENFQQTDKDTTNS